ncbi:MAG: LysE family translocator [Paludibacteraceae bacterium]|nr:LysE family translocator [Paludibacteraceae bacterium]
MITLSTIILTGFLIGFVLSIPVGPIAVLCIQRTLNRGKYHGWITGIGASTSDVFYAALAIFGLSFVVDFINTHEMIIEIIGAVVFVFLGIKLYKENPSANLSTENVRKESYLQDYLTAFGLTISNPLIIFLFITVFAQTEFVNSQTSIYQIVIALVSVFIGACMWWFLLTSLVNLLRNKINVRGLGLLNKLSGGMLIILAIVGLIVKNI